MNKIINELIMECVQMGFDFQYCFTYNNGKYIVKYAPKSRFQSKNGIEVICMTTEKSFVTSIGKYMKCGKIYEGFYGVVKS